MDQKLPIACSLDGVQRSERIAEISAIGRDALTRVDVLPGTTVLRFTGSEPTRNRLEAIVAAEAHCCPFLRLALSDEADAIVLTIQAPTGAEELAADMVSAFERAELRTHESRSRNP